MTISIAPSIETQNSFFEREIRFFPIKKWAINFLQWIYNGYIHQLIRLFDEAYTDLQGALVVVKEYTQADAKRDLPVVKKALKVLITYNGFLEQAEYFQSDEVKAKMNLVISTMYDVEIQLKKKAFIGQPRVATNPELIEAIASASKEAMSRALSR